MTSKAVEGVLRGSISMKYGCEAYSCGEGSASPARPAGGGLPVGALDVGERRTRHFCATGTDDDAVT